MEAHTQHTHLRAVVEAKAPAFLARFSLIGESANTPHGDGL
jgi:hypothetical protein